MDDAKHGRMDFAALLRAAHGEALNAPGYQKRANRCVVEKYQRILGHQDVLAQTLVETMAAACECGGSGCESNCALLQIVIRQPCKDAIAHAIECGLLQAHGKDNLEFPHAFSDHKWLYARAGL
jgi:hypothetical protein